ncbi:hypothetical protein [Ralstonia pseudosolanacearum]|uniref:Transmembrane protein n=1 Tax=Ralstonia solanacearum TaxID=305 RepID=A0AA92Q9P6_RALSL|nr:hypothetical protein [Ralstonia pseudosolanacearum]QOK95011.1 hypothetical protein HF909_00115 [Ralstonia pseudosolanacearum]UWD90981.1 hypothetical protein NY025_07865 [Ralstonia pseudosolanacearum]CAH0442614.1 hypothetical protein LMG9673_03429 [Ralstonia pseudosolanacearum]
METLSLVVEVAIPMTIGLTVSLYLRGVTNRLLVDLCGTQTRSDFWVRVTTILITGTPLLLALAFGLSGRPDAATGDVARRALSMSTLGIVIAVGSMARAIMGSLPKAAAGSQPAGASA